MVCPPPEFDWSSWATWSCLREDIAPVATFIGAAIVAWAALVQARTARRRHEEQTKADLERRITESFAKAVEQLGSEKLEIRLGGIYTLERLSRESEREYWPIMETLTAYVRERAPWPPRQAASHPSAQLRGGGTAESAAESPSSDETADQGKEPEPKSERIRPATDLQAVLTVLGRRKKEMRDREGKDQRLDLSSTDLRGAHLSKAPLAGANLSEAHLEGANLVRTNLAGARLWKAHLEGAFLSKAHLPGAKLIYAHLAGAFLSETNLAGAFLSKTNLAGARLSKARLKGAFLSETNFAGADLSETNLAGASLWKAHLEGAFLLEAHLPGANLVGANLVGANFKDANLKGARKLTQEQINSTLGDENTILPEGLERPAHWSKR